MKELVDHKLTRTSKEAFSLIDDFAGLETNPINAIDDELIHNLKIVKLHNILQLQLLMKKMKYESENKNEELHTLLEKSVRTDSFNLFGTKIKESVMQNYETSPMKARDIKQKRKDAKSKDDDDVEFPSVSNNSNLGTKKNPPRRRRNAKRNHNSMMEADFNMDDDSEFSEG